jgi:raffinose/stachyose/melibiose transport system permease protein
VNYNKIYPRYFIAPILIVFAVFGLLPGIVSIVYSFTDWNSFSDEVNFVGLANYREMFAGGREYAGYIANTFSFAIFTTIAKTLVGLALALFLVSRVKLRGFHRMVIFSPQVMSALIVSLVFRAILHPSTGLLNTSLRAIGLDALARNWLTDLGLAFPTVMTVDTWKGVGYIMVLLIAGMQSIPESYYEAAVMDGASYFKRVRFITLPMLAPVLVNCTVLNLTYGFRVFDMVYALTGGGPGHATSVINTAVFKSFSDGDYGMGSALSSVLFVFLMALSYFIIRAMDAKVEEAS